jgi:histidine ammonia-lyase
MTVVLGAEPLDRDRYERVVGAHETVALDPAALERVGAARERLLAHLESGASAYGVTTGVGYLSRTALDAADQQAFQRALLVRGAGTGPPLPPDVVRGGMLLRLTGFLQGAAGVSLALCEFLAARLNDGWSPVVPSRGIEGAGEVVALSHLFQTLAGEGTVLEDGEPIPAAEALARRGATPYAPGIKEGIALVNGAPLAPALTAHLTSRAHALLDHATLAGALTAALVGASLRPYSPRIGALKGDPGQQRVHATLAALHDGGADWSDRPQPPVSFRVLPQVHGAALDLLDHVDAQVERELRAATDSPVLLEADGDEPAGLYPTGNFHAAALALGLDALAIAFAHVGNLAEKRLHRLLDARFSGLPDQLAADPGRQTGLVFLHKAAVGYAAENRLLSAPASVHAADGSAGQEDAQAFAFLAGDKLGRILDNVELLVASELLADAQAHALGDVALAPRLHDAVGRLDVDRIDADRSLSDDVERIRTLLRQRSIEEPTVEERS